MFDSYETTERGFSAPLFVTQVILAPLGGLILGGIATVLLENLFGMKDNTFQGYFVYSLQGLLLGFKVQAAFPRAVESGGRWVWVVPVLNTVFWIVNETGRGASSDLSNYFVLQHRPGLAGIEMLIITLPAVASCTYSFGVALASQPPRSNWVRYLHRILLREGPAKTSES